MQAASRSPSEHCAVCSGAQHKPNTRVVICAECADPERVKTYCTNCTHRLNLSLEEARNLFEQTGIQIDKTGCVFKFKKCPMCTDEFIPPPDIFSVDQDDFGPLHLA